MVEYADECRLEESRGQVTLFHVLLDDAHSCHDPPIVGMSIVGCLSQSIELFLLLLPIAYSGHKLTEA